MQTYPSTAIPTRSNFNPTTCESQSIQRRNSRTSSTENANTTPIRWQCTKCGCEYIDPSPKSLFITPPPTTPCIQIQTDKTWTQTRANGGFANLCITGGATCDYVRIGHNAREIELGEQIDAIITAVEDSAVTEHSARVFDRVSMKAVGEHERVSRQSGAADTTYDEIEDDPEECEFWKAECKDIDCIYEAKHYRYQCALAELGEEPESKVPVLSCGRRFRWLAK